MKKYLVTGGFGFIGTNFCTQLLMFEKDAVVGVLDALTYAAKPEWLKSVVKQLEAENRFVEFNCNLKDEERVQFVVNTFQPDVVVHFAAESHVCKSIETPRKFLESNVIGTYNLLEACYRHWKDQNKLESSRFHHVSTDEVFGELPLEKKELKFTENTPYSPRSPYAASKAASDHFVMAFHHTYGMNVSISNCSNNYGYPQDEEKLIPKTITAFLEGKPAELYGEGTQVRDWLWVADHCFAIRAIIDHGKNGERYLIGGDDERSNKEVTEILAKLMNIEYKCVKSDKRPTDDKRYAIDTSKLKALGWKQEMNFEMGLFYTIEFLKLEYRKKQEKTNGLF